MIRYYVSQDLIDLDDDGDEQVSIYKSSVDSDTKLSPHEVIALVEEEADWEIIFGEGDWDKIDMYFIEGKDLQTNNYFFEWEGGTSCD